MKTLIVLIVLAFLGFWLFQKNGLEVFQPLSTAPSSTSTGSASVTSSVNISTTTAIALLQNIGDKLKDWGKDVNIFGGFEKATSSPMNDNFSVHMASFNFPQSYFIRSIRQAVIDGGVGESFCTGTLKTSQVLTPAGQKSIAGLTFNKSTWSDAGAGNVYQGIVYSTRKDEKCYAITLFLHTTQPENYADGQAQATQFRAEHEVAVKKIMEKFESIVSAFQLP